MSAPDRRTGFSSGPDLDRALLLAASLAVPVLEVAAQHPGLWPAQWDAVRRNDVRARAESAGIELVVHSDSAVNVADLHPALRRAAEEDLLGYLELCRDLGSETLVVHAGVVFGGNTTAALDASAQTLARVARAAEDLSVTLVLENMNVVPGEIRYLGTTAAEVSRILDEVGSPALVACADVGHAHLLPGGVPEFVNALRGRIGYVQLTDNDGLVDDHLRLGSGSLDLAVVAAALDAADFTGAVVIELDGEEDRLTSLPIARAALDPRRND